MSLHAGQDYIKHWPRLAGCCSVKNIGASFCLKYRSTVISVHSHCRQHACN